MKIAVVGAGIFGITAAIKLAEAGHKVDLYEKNVEILAAASGINQYRLHRGYHYPRSKSTALSSKYAEESFRREYGTAIIDHNEHYYSIAKEGSLVSGREFLTFCKECELDYKEVRLDDHISPEQVDLTIHGAESLIDPIKLKEVARQKLEKSEVRLFLGQIFMPEQIDDYERVVNATYANSNFILEKFPEAKRDYQFEVCEKPVLKLPAKYHSKSIVILDGPFFCIDPYGQTDLHVMGNVVHAIHATNVGQFPVVPEEIKPLLDKGIIKDPPVSNISHFLTVAQKFMPDLKGAEHIGSMFTVRTVLPGVDATDERPTLVSEVGDKIINVFSGKLGNSVEAAEQVVRLVR